MSIGFARADARGRGTAMSFGRMSFGALLVLAASLVVTACSAEQSGSPVEGETVAQTDAPATTLAVGVRPDPDNVLRATVEFSTDDAVRPEVTVTDPDGRGMRIVPSELGSGDHHIPLLGLRAATSFDVEVVAGEASGTTSFRTGDLPDDLPPLDLAAAEPQAMTPGLTLFDAIPLSPGSGGGPSDDGYLLVVDAAGEVVWYHRQTHSIQDVRRAGNGDLLFVHFETGVRRIDPVDGDMTEWSGATALDDATADAHGRPYAGDEAIRVDTDQMHHEVIELPNGNLMTLSREMRTIDGFPDPICDHSEDGFDGSYQVVADTVVEFAPDTGDVVNEWSLFDLIDPLEELDAVRAPEFCSPYLEDVYPGEQARDWTHANAVVLDEARNAVLVSVRHLDQIVAIRYRDDADGSAGELLWRLGEGGDFTLENGEWFLHQHAPQVLEDGSVMIYDNGNNRPGTSLDDPDALPYSRAVRYEVDTESMTARQVWEHRLDAPGEAVYAPFVGDADAVGETVLITHGGLLDPPAHSPQEEGVLPWARIVEVDVDTDRVVFDLRMKDPAGEDGWIIYRAERIPTIYPPGYEVEVLD